MQKTRYVVEMGSINTSVFYQSLILKEPTVVVIRRDKGTELVAWGNDAFNMVNKIDDKCSFCTTVIDDVVVDVSCAAAYLSECLARAIPKKTVISAEIYALIPCGISVLERENIENAFLRAGYKDVTLVEKIYGMLPFVNYEGSIALTIGDGTSEFGVLTDKGVVNACSLNIGVAEINKRIASRVRDVYNIDVSDNTADKLRRELASLFENNSASMPVLGRDVLDRKLKWVDISAEQIKSALIFCYKRILDVAESLLTTIPAQLMESVVANGIYISGVGSDLQGLEDYISRYLHLSVHKDAEPETTLLRGIAALLKNGRLAQLTEIKR